MRKTTVTVVEKLNLKFLELFNEDCQLQQLIDS